MRPKSIPEPPIERGTPFEKFKKLAKQVLSVPKAEIDRRELQYQEQRKIKSHHRHR